MNRIVKAVQATVRGKPGRTVTAKMIRTAYAGKRTRVRNKRAVEMRNFRRTVPLTVRSLVRMNTW